MQKMANVQIRSLELKREVRAIWKYLHQAYRTRSKRRDGIVADPKVASDSGRGPPAGAERGERRHKHVRVQVGVSERQGLDS
jgi:hypothetical protein